MGPSGITANYSSVSNASGYITEKMYVLLQLYLQNKSWNTSLELLQCFPDLKETSMLPSTSYLQMLITRIALNGQGRLVLRENGKLIIPYEQFANAIMMKHLDGPHGSHLSLEGTIRAIMENFTVGREYFGMEKEFIIEMVQNCPSPTCRYYKVQIESTKKGASLGSTFSSDSEISSSTLHRPNFSHNAEFQMTLHMPIGSHIGTSLHDISDNRNTANQRPQNYTFALKKVNTKLHDSSSLAVATSEVYKATPELLRSSSESYDNNINNNIQNVGNSGKEILSLHNGLWTVDTEIKGVRSTAVYDGQEKIIRAFTEVMKNMSRMKTCVRPAMCKPYGKQSETLQKTLVDTIQLIQSLRSFLPPPHIPVSSWKNEDKYGLDHTNISYLPVL